MAENNSTPKKISALREYQVELLEAAKKQNIIVCLGTGTGKTFIAIKLIEYLARENDTLEPYSQGAKRTFFLVNSVPLVFQQAEAIRSNTALKVKAFCGEMGVDFWTKDQWLKEFENHHVLVMTHQIYLDLIQHRRHGFSLSQANLLVFDECHHANKNHPFKKIMDCFGDVRNQHNFPRILGLTASVVGKKVKPFQIGDEIKKLESTMRSVCKTARDPDVVEKYGAKPKEILRPYLSSSHLDPVAAYLEYEFRSVLDPLDAFLNDVKVLNEASGSREVIKRELDVARGAVRECLSALEDIGIWAANEVSVMLVEDLEKRIKKVSSGLSPHAKTASLLLQTTLTSLRELSWKYDEFRIANRGGSEKVQQEYLKPKVKELLKLFTETRGEQSDICSIVFVQKRYAACVVSKLITLLASTCPEYSHLKSDFVTGHGSEIWGISDTEMNFKKQEEKLTGFRTGKFNVLVGTSVVEEGVDIPKCNLVVMFDFPQNYRAFVQSRGRGRAKDAKYVMLVLRSEFGRRKQEQESYQSVDEHLRKYCQEDREGPTEEEINDAINVYALPNFYTDVNAKLDMGNSISRLYRYCSKLPCDRFTSLKPIFTTSVVNDDEFQCTLKMPGNSHITGIIKGEPMESKKEARQAVAYEACKLLLELGGLDENILPVADESSSESDGDDDVDGPSQHKTGTKKRQRSHLVKTSNQLYGQLTTDGTKKLYVYAINMMFDEVHNTVKEDLWSRKNVSLGIITNEKLPTELPSFFLYNDIGKLKVTLERCQSVPVLSPKQRNLIDWFHNFIFTETLELKLASLTRNGCRVVLLNNVESKLDSSRRTLSAANGINFHEMELLKSNVLETNGKFSSDTDLLDSVVIEGYLRDFGHKKPGHYLVVKLTGGTPSSRFPIQNVATTFKEYFEGRYNLEVKNHSQPLLEVVHHSRRIDCRSKDCTRRKPRTQRLIPEFLEFRSSPESLTLRALFLPVILYRVDSLVSMIELRDTLSKEMADSTPYDVIMPESPRKKLRASSSEASTAQPMTTLQQYFSPFDSSKIVPLFQLLEAVTCASSQDDFNLERLEMLGDSFLKMAVSIHVYWHKNHKDEGRLTTYRTRQISNKNLFKLAMKRDLVGYIKYSPFNNETCRLLPGFISRKMENGNLLSFSDDDDTDDVIHSEISDDDVMTQKISDKSVADSMEALIGAHFIYCGYIGALRFMTWLGVDVFYSKRTEDEQLTNGNRRKSPTPHDSSKYANYPPPTLDIPADEDRARYKKILDRQTKEMKTFEEKIGYTFNNKVLLLEAFTHPTYNDNTITGSYQRLEFLGDAILDFLVTQHIYNNSRKDLTPGELTDLRSALVNNNIFAVIAVQNDYHKYLKEYSPDLFSTIGHFVKGVQQYQKDLGTAVIPDAYVIPVNQSDSSDVECIEAPKPLGDVFESVAGAIFLDSDLDVSEVWRVCYPMLKKFIDEYSTNVPKNPVRSVKEEDENAVFSSAKILEDGRVSCVLTFKHKEYEGVGRNKHNAKLSASYKALKYN